jgi:hypothetical protein
MPGRFLRSRPRQSQCPTGHLDQQHLQRHHDLLFRRPQVKEDGIACRRERTLTRATVEDTPLTTLCQIGGNGTNVASVYQPIMGTVRVGAWLAPVLGFSYRPNLLSCGCVLHTDRKFGLFSFSKYYRVSTGISGSNFKQVLRNPRRNGLPVKLVDGAFLMRHEHLAGASVELSEIAETSSSSNRLLHHAPEAFDRVQVMSTVCR